MQTFPQPKENLPFLGGARQAANCFRKGIAWWSQTITFEATKYSIEKQKYLLGRNVSSEQRCLVIVLCVIVVLPLNSQTQSYHGGENLKQAMLHKRSFSTSLGHKNLHDDDDFQKAKSSYWIQASENFLNWHFSEISACNDQQWQSVACTGQFSVQNSTFKSCLSSFLSFEPSFLLPDAQSQSGPHSSRPPINGSKFPPKASLGA